MFAIWRLIVVRVSVGDIGDVTDVYKDTLLNTSIDGDDDVGVMDVNLPRVVSVYHVLAS